MRTLFTILNVAENSLSFQNWMQESGIKHVKRVVLTSTTAVVHFVVDTEDYNSILTVEHWVDPEARRWEITACNKQYVREYVGDAVRYLGSMCEVGPLNARDHNEEHPYHWSLYDGVFDVHWVAEFRNPNSIRHFTSDPKPLTVSERWPVDPRCPQSAFGVPRDDRRFYAT